MQDTLSPPPVPYALCLIFSLLIILGPFSSSASPILRQESCATSSNDVALALTYAYPLALYVQTFGPVLNTKGANVIDNDNTTSSASGASLVRPNANYVYSRIAVDLSHDNVNISLPNVTDRPSFVYPFYDLYGNNFANLGSVDSSGLPGNYLMCPADAHPPGIKFNDPLHPEYTGVIYFPTSYGSVEPRILQLNQGSDLQAVHHIQSMIKTKIVTRSGEPIAPALTSSLLQDGALSPAAYSPPYDLSSGNATLLLDLLSTLSPYNPPENISDTNAVNDMLARAGIQNGSYHGLETGLDMTCINGILVQNFTRALTPSPALWDNHGNDWWDFHANISGNFHTNYLIRAYIAYHGYLQLMKSQALYPQWFGDGPKMQLNANQSYIFTYSGKPPSQSWSITAYGPTNYLIPNPLDRFSLGSTSNITYPDGSQVYNSSARTDDNRPFQILMQPADVSPPKNWTGNWLPAPAGGGVFNINFRTYGPSPALSNGSYVYPVVTKQAALT